MLTRKLAYKARDEEARAEDGRPGIALVRAWQIERGTEACFLTERRLYCQEQHCQWRKECCRLVAVWRR